MFYWIGSRFIGRPAPFATSHIIDREWKITNNKTVCLDTKNNEAAGYLGPLKIEFRKGAEILGLYVDKRKYFSKRSAPCEDRTHDLQISMLDYETDALPTALTRHSCQQYLYLFIFNEIKNVSCRSIKYYYYISQLVRSVWLVNFARRISLYGPQNLTVVPMLLTWFSRSMQ